MADDNSQSQSTRDHEEIQRWADKHNARPATVKNDPGLLRFQFDNSDDDLEPISWDEFFQTFDQRGLELVYDNNPDSKFAKLIYPENNHQ